VTGTGGERFSLLGRTLPASFIKHQVTIDAGCECAYEATEWHDALVVVEAGELELECVGGSRTRFGDGSVLCFQSLPLRTLRNPGRESLLLIAVSRAEAR
jgi:hypothetical protein